MARPVGRIRESPPAESGVAIGAGWKCQVHRPEGGGGAPYRVMCTVPLAATLALRGLVESVSEKIGLRHRHTSSPVRPGLDLLFQSLR